jgi:FMN phosphatase YigB (HAD superfamily)
MVGDHLEADICGALQAGFQRAVWLAPRWRAAYEDPRVTTVRRLDQVPMGLMTVARQKREPGGEGRRARLNG